MGRRTSSADNSILLDRQAFVYAGGYPNTQLKFVWRTIARSSSRRSSESRLTAESTLFSWRCDCSSSVIPPKSVMDISWLRRSNRLGSRRMNLAIQAW